MIDAHGRRARREGAWLVCSMLWVLISARAMQTPIGESLFPGPKSLLPWEKTARISTHDVF